jgi:acetolactate synthase-1/2/3 large subunit
MTMVSGGQAVLDVLKAAGVDHAFTVPGESFMGLLDAMAADPDVRIVSTRHEEGAAFMAAAYARISGRLSVAMGTRMVGGGNLSIGVHTARQDSTPMIVVLGQVPTGWRHREAFQEVELATIFGGIAKWAVEVPSPDRLAELTARACRVALSGRPGPVALVLREDVLESEVEAPAAPRPIVVPRPAPDPVLVEQALDLVRASRRPVMVLGAGVLASGAIDACVRLAETEQVPAMTGWRRPDAFPNSHPLYLGWAGLRSPRSPIERLKAADLIVAIGTRLGEFPTVKYTVPGAGQRLVHVDIAAEQLGGHVHADVGIVADARLFVEALLEASARRPWSDEERSRCTGRAESNAADRQVWESQTTPGQGRARSGFVDQQVVAGQLRELLPPDAIVTSDAGNFAGWPARFLRWEQPGSFLGPSSGAMGYGVPAAIGAKLAFPDRPVVCVAGDGGMLMTGMELETAVRERAPIVVIVYDNQLYGTIRMHHRNAPVERDIGASLGPVDFAGLARALGGVGSTVSDAADFPAAFRDALGADRPAVIHLRVDPEQLFVGDEP